MCVVGGCGGATASCRGRSVTCRLTGTFRAEAGASTCPALLALGTGSTVGGCDSAEAGTTAALPGMSGPGAGTSTATAELAEDATAGDATAAGAGAFALPESW